MHLFYLIFQIFHVFFHLEIRYTASAKHSGYVCTPFCPWIHPPSSLRDIFRPRYKSNRCPAKIPVFAQPISSHQCQAAFLRRDGPPGSHNSSPEKTSAIPKFNHAATREVPKRAFCALFFFCNANFCRTWFRPRPPARCGNGFCSHCFYPMRETSAAPDSSHAPPARYKSGFCSHCFYPMRANLRCPRFRSCPTGEVRRGAIGLP